MTVLGKFAAYGNGDQDLIWQPLWHIIMLLQSRAEALHGKEDSMAVGFGQLGSAINLARFCARFWVGFGALDSLLTGSYIKPEEPVIYGTLRKTQQISSVIYQLCEAPSFVQMVAPALNTKNLYDGGFLGRISTSMWVYGIVTSLFLDYMRLLRTAKKARKETDEDTKKQLLGTAAGLRISMLCLLLDLPLAVNWTKKTPFLNTQQIATIGLMSSLMRLQMHWSRK